MRIYTKKARKEEDESFGKALEVEVEDDIHLMNEKVIEIREEEGECENILISVFNSTCHKVRLLKSH